MTPEDRKILTAICVALVVVALELAWVIFITPVLENEDWFYSSVFWTTFFSAVLTLFTFGLVWLARAARSDHIAVNRAFVFLEDTEIKRYPATGQIAEWRLAAVWRNGGNTPTERMLNHVNWCTFRGEMPEDYGFDDLGARDDIPLHLGPKASLGSYILKIPHTVINEVRQGHLRLYIYGWAEYNDVFRGTIRHRTEFCREISVQMDASDPQQLLIGFVLSTHRRYNCAD